MYIFDSEHDTGDCPNIEIVSRDSWGARRPISPSTLYIILFVVLYSSNDWTMSYIPAMFTRDERSTELPRGS